MPSRHLTALAQLLHFSAKLCSIYSNSNARISILETSHWYINIFYKIQDVYHRLRNNLIVWIFMQWQSMIWRQYMIKLPINQHVKLLYAITCKVEKKWSLLYKNPNTPSFSVFHGSKLWGLSFSLRLRDTVAAGLVQHPLRALRCVDIAFPITGMPTDFFTILIMSQATRPAVQENEGCKGRWR